jgi:hypothetical protein
MSFLMPKPPKVVQTPAATPPQQANAADASVGTNTTLPGSFISTSSQGLTRKARTQKPSLIGESSAN